MSMLIACDSNGAPDDTRTAIRRRTVPLVFMVALVLPVGCRVPAAEQTDVRSVPPSERRRSTEPLATGGNSPAAEARRVPVVLHSRFNPTPLTDEQMCEILGEARRLAPRGKDVWFILLKSNGEYEGALRYCVNVYFTPDIATARLRKGRYIGLGGGFEEIREIIQKLFDAEDQAARQGDSHTTKERQFVRLHEYYQVSLCDEPFGDDLGAPSGTLLPFAAPEGVSDVEVVEVVDFARTNPAVQPRPNTFPVPSRFNGSAPVIGIERKDGMIEILCGVSEGMLSGMGELMQCKKEDGTLKVVALGQWVF